MMGHLGLIKLDSNIDVIKFTDHAIMNNFSEGEPPLKREQFVIVQGILAGKISSLRNELVIKISFYLVKGNVSN